MISARKALLAAMVLAPTSALGAKTDVYAIVGARIVTVSGPVIDAGTMILRDGLIEAVAGSAPLPPDARVIDGKGWTLTPGLIDGFGGLGLPAPGPARPGAERASPPPASSPTPAPLAPQAMALDRLRPAEASKARNDGVTTALVIGPEGVLPGRSVLVDLVGDKLDDMVLRQPAAMHLHLSSLARQYPTSLMGTVAYARQQLLGAARYRDAWADYETAPLGKKRPEYDASLAAWADVLAGRLALVVTASRENDLRRALALADEFKVRVVVAGAPHASRLAGLVKTRKLPLLVSVNFDPPRPVPAFSGEDEEKERREIEEAERNPAALHAAGVAFGFGSGHAPSYVAGIRKAIEKGLPPQAALRAATLGAAEALGIADRTGSLEAGKIANVVAWADEPFAKDAKVKLVFVDGRLHEPEEPAAKDRKKEEEDARPEPATAAAAPKPAEAPPPAAEATLAIVGGTVLTVGPQGTIEKGTVVVQNGKIVAVGADVHVPPGARVIDASGRFVMPGIVDTHSHTAIEGGVNECSDSVTAEVRIADVVDHRDVNIYRQLGGGVTTVNALHGSCNAIGGENAVLKLRWGRPPDELVFREAPRGIKFALGENPKRANFRVPGQPRYPGTRMGVEVVIRDAFKAAQAYTREWEEYEKKRKATRARAPLPVAPRRDLRMETLRDVLAGKVLVHAHCYRADEILMLIRLADELGFKVRTFQHVLEGYKVAAEIARHGAGAGTFIDWWAFKLEAYDATPYNPAVLASKGVRVSLNSDSDELARRLYWDAAKAVKYGGVAEEDALKMITIHPAWQLGVDQRVGSIEVGKDGDIAVFSAHPFSPDARCEMTLVDGTVYFDRSRDLAARPGPAAAPGGAR